MWNGVDCVGVLVTFSGGFIVGVLVGMILFAMMDKEGRK